VALYEYRCEQDGVFDTFRQIGTAPESLACPECGGEARRVFSKPLLKSVPRDVIAALDHEEKTRESPDIVTSLPPRPAHKRTPVAPLTPTLARLPRP
jgi:putative FmdB family regulatory protein